MGAAKDAARRAVARGMAWALRARSELLPSIDGVTLIVAPHPDDETLGCGGLIARQAAMERRVHVVFLTDGEASHRSHPRQDAAALGAQRQAEALAALARLGVRNPRSAATFLGAPDGRLAHLDAEESGAVQRALTNWIRSVRPEATLTPFRGGGSSEHDAAQALTRAAHEAAGSPGFLLEYPVWAWWNGFRLRPRLRVSARNFRLPLTAEFRQAKIAALACHRSQTEPTPPWTEPTLPAALARAGCGAQEFYFALGKRQAG